jgi:hypothetical protein
MHCSVDLAWRSAGQITVHKNWHLVRELLPVTMSKPVLTSPLVPLALPQVPSGSVRNAYLERRLTLQDLLREAPPEVRQKEAATAAQVGR